MMVIENKSSHIELRWFEKVYHKKRLFYVPTPYAPSLDVKRILSSKKLRKTALDAEIIDPKKMPEGELRKLCKLNGISYYAALGQLLPNANANPFRVPRKVVEKGDVPLKAPEFRKFITYLTKINKKSALIARIIWNLNQKLVRVGAFVTLEEVLRLKWSHVHLHVKNIHLMRMDRGRVLMVAMELPHYIFKDVIRLRNSNNLFVFDNRYGGPLSAKQIAAHFQMAGELSKIRGLSKGFTVTPGMLRPIYRPSKNKKTMQKKNPVKGSIKLPYSYVVEYVDELLLLLPVNPKNVGVKSKCGHKEILKAIIYRLQTGCKWSELPGHFPSWIAVSAQFQRWKKSGFIQKIKDFFASNAVKSLN